MLCVLIYVDYALLGLYHTPSADSLALLTDPWAHLPPAPEPGRVPPLVARSPAMLPDDAIPVLGDMPVGLVNRVVFGPRAARRRAGETL